MLLSLLYLRRELAQLQPSHDESIPAPSAASNFGLGFPLQPATADAMSGMPHAVHLAAYRGHVALVEASLASGADVNASTHDGMTPLMYCAQQVTPTRHYPCDTPTPHKASHHSSCSAIHNAAIEWKLSRKDKID